MNVCQRLGAVLMVTFLAGCQTLGTRSGPEQMPSAGAGDWQRDQVYFNKALVKHEVQTAWQLNAKVAVHTPQLKESANLIWNYQDQASQLRLFGPLGAGAVRVEFDQYGVQLSDGQGILHRGDNAEALLTKIVGWPIPVDALRYWLFALPHPSHTYEYKLNQLDQLSELRQLGWRVSYDKYSDAAPEQWNSPLARRITAVRHVGEDQLVKVKLVTKAWKP